MQKSKLYSQKPMKFGENATCKMKYVHKSRHHIDFEIWPDISDINIERLI